MLRPGVLGQKSYSRFNSIEQLLPIPNFYRLPSEGHFCSGSLEALAFKFHVDEVVDIKYLRQITLRRQNCKLVGPGLCLPTY